MNIKKHLDIADTHYRNYEAEMQIVGEEVALRMGAEYSRVDGGNFYFTLDGNEIEVDTTFTLVTTQYRPMSYLPTGDRIARIKMIEKAEAIARKILEELR